MTRFWRMSFGLVLALAALANGARAEATADTSLDSEVEQYLAQNSGPQNKEHWDDPATLRAYWKTGIKF